MSFVVRVPVTAVALWIATLVVDGLAALVVNALLFMLTGWLAEQLELPFRVHGLWAAFWGAIVVALVSGRSTWPSLIGAGPPEIAEPRCRTGRRRHMVRVHEKGGGPKLCSTRTREVAVR